MRVLNIGIALFFICALNTLAQDAVYPVKLLSKFYFFEGKINDTNQLELKIMLFNAGKSNAYIDTILINGDQYDFYGNLYFEFQVLRSGKYVPYKDLSIDYRFGDSTPVVKVNYKVLKPGDSAILKYNIFNRTNSASKGKYKMRVNLLKVPMNNISGTPADYITSRWFYYEITRDLYREQNLEQ